jgi:hypothetical protein
MAATPIALVAASGLSVDTFRPGEPVTRGGADLSDPRLRQALETDITAVLSRPFRAVIAAPARMPLTWVPSFVMTHVSGRVTVVDVLADPAPGDDGAEALLAMLETARLCELMGWAHRLLVPDGTTMDAQALAELVLSAPTSMCSDELTESAFFYEPLPALLEAITGCGDLVWLWPYLEACLAEDARLAALSGPAQRHALPPRAA